MPEPAPASAGQKPRIHRKTHPRAFKTTSSNPARPRKTHVRILKRKHTSPTSASKYPKPRKSILRPPKPRPSIHQPPRRRRPALIHRFFNVTFVKYYLLLLSRLPVTTKKSRFHRESLDVLELLPMHIEGGFRFYLGGNMRYHLNHMQNIQYLEKSIMIEEENARMFCDEPERWLDVQFHFNERRNSIIWLNEFVDQLRDFRDNLRDMVMQRWVVKAHKVCMEDWRKRRRLPAG